MNPFIKFAILFIVDIYIFWNFGKLFGFLGLGVILYRLLNTLGLIRSPQIYRGAFSEGIVYLKDYQGSYRNPVHNQGLVLRTAEDNFCVLRQPYNHQSLVLIPY